MRMRGAPGIRPGSGKGQAVRCRRAVPVTSTVLGGMGLTASVPVPESGRRTQVVRRGPGRASCKERS
jgi:hypothetical protein